MKAAIHQEYGPPGVIQVKEVEKPVLKENEVLIKVHAATFNRTDCAMVTGKPFIILVEITFFICDPHDTDHFFLNNERSKQNIVCSNALSSP